MSISIFYFLYLYEITNVAVLFVIIGPLFNVILVFISMRNEFVISSVALVIGMTFSQSGFAREADDFYIGAKTGGAIYDNACGKGSTSCDDETSFSGGVYAGYQLSDMFALEGGYTYLGGPSAKYPAAGNPDLQAEYESSVHDVDLALKADYSLSDDASVFGKLGGVYWRADSEGDDPSLGKSKVTESGVSAMLGTGFEYRLTPKLSSRLEYQYINGVGDDSSIGASDVHLVTVGIDYQFGGASKHTVQEEREADAVPSAPEVKPEVIEKYTQVLSEASKSGSFKTGSATLSTMLKSNLNPILERLNQFPESTVVISGYSDSTGLADYNLKLSKARAQSVADYLVSKGINPNRITVEGFGELRPIASNETAEGRRMNRRVVVTSPQLIQKAETSLKTQ